MGNVVVKMGVQGVQYGFLRIILRNMTFKTSLCVLLILSSNEYVDWLWLAPR